jgi:transposase
MGKNINIPARQLFTISEKHAMIQEYLESGVSKEQVWRKHTGKTHKGRLTVWMHELGYLTSEHKIMPYIARNQSELEKPHISDTSLSPMEIDNALLKKRVADLERQLKDAQMKAIAFETMVEIAEKETKIPIRKKYSAKP